jgi:ADP-ribose pyrophosphatase
VTDLTPGDLTPSPSPARRGVNSDPAALSSQERGLGGEVRTEPWEVLGTEYLLRTPWRDIRSDQLRLHNGEEARYDYFETADAAFVVPVTRDGKIVVMRQYRHPIRAWTWEIVGGGVGDEGPEEAARRELHEEIGGHCEKLIPLGTAYLSVASMNTRSYSYLALDVELGETERETMEELLEIVLLEPDDAFERARDGRIDESQSALAILKAEALIRAHLAAQGR